MQNKIVGTAKKCFQEAQEMIEKQKEIKKTDLKGLTVGFVAVTK